MERMSYILFQNIRFFTKCDKILSIIMQYPSKYHESHIFALKLEFCYHKNIYFTYYQNQKGDEITNKC